MRKIFAILGALLTGGLGIALLGASQSASAALDIELGRRKEIAENSSNNWSNHLWRNRS